MNSSVKSIDFMRRIDALRRLQLEAADIDEKFSLQVLKLEEKYDYKLEPILERRRQIIMGEYEPRDEESDTALTYVDVPENHELDEIDMEGLKGIPGFWFTVLNNIPVFWSMIQRHDCDPLTYLNDISCTKIINPDPGFILKFSFAPNPYFTNNVLTKQYKLEFGKKTNDPFNMYGPEVHQCFGCEINWKSHDLTVTLKKNKVIKRASFFNFFDPPNTTDDPKLQPYVMNFLLMDFQLAYYLKERVIPKAVLYYIGEAVLRENFGFAKDFQKTTIGDSIIEDQPPLYDPKSRLKNAYELERNIWEESEKALAERLTKQKFSKAKDFEKSKIFNNLFNQEMTKEEIATKFNKSKQLRDMLYGKNNPCEKEVIKIMKDIKKSKDTKRSQRKQTQEETRAPKKGNRRKEKPDQEYRAPKPTSSRGEQQEELLSYSEVKTKKRNKPLKRNEEATEPAINADDPVFDEFLDVQKNLLSFYNEKAKQKDTSPKQDTGEEAPLVTRKIFASDLDMNIETLLAAYQQERNAKKQNQKAKTKR